MDLLKLITANFQEWHCRIFDDGTMMHSQKFSGEIHSKLKDNFTNAYNLFSQNSKTIIVSCFDTYTNITVLSEN